jgi:hypothetical protein
MAAGRTLRWNGKDLPEELRDLPPGTYVFESIEPPMLSHEQETALSAALTSLRAGNGRVLEQFGNAILKAHVRNGRLLLDEPTGLPEGDVVELVQIDEAFVDGDDLDDEERAALQRELDASFEDEEAGRLIDLADAIADLRATR